MKLLTLVPPLSHRLAGVEFAPYPRRAFRPCLSFRLSMQTENAVAAELLKNFSRCWERFGNVEFLKQLAWMSFGPHGCKQPDETAFILTSIFG